MNYLSNEAYNATKKPKIFPFILITALLFIIYLVLSGYDYSYSIYNVRLIILALAVAAFIFLCLIAHNIFFKARRAWCIAVGAGMVFLNMYALELFNPGNYKITGNILFVVLLLAFIVVFLWISKNRYGKVFHTINIMLLSTYSLFMLSIVFSSYYNMVYNVTVDINNSNFFSVYVSFCKIALRYFFEFPPDEYLDIVTIFQYIIGKIYEAVLIGGIASLITKTVVNSEDN